MSVQVLKTRVMNHAVIAESWPELLERFGGLTYVGGGDQFKLVQSDGTAVVVEDVKLNDEMGERSAGFAPGSRPGGRPRLRLSFYSEYRAGVDRGEE